MSDPVEEVVLHYRGWLAPRWTCTINGEAGNVGMHGFGEGDTPAEALDDAERDALAAAGREE